MPAVLIVVDAPAVLTPTDSPLRRRETVLVFAASLERGIAELGGRSPDLVLVDLRLAAGGADGLVDGARAAGAGCAVFAVADGDEREKWSGLAVDGFVSRPLTAGRLLDALGRCVPVVGRGASRAALTVPVDLARRDDAAHGILKDVSASGVLLATGVSLDPGERLTLSFSLPISGAGRVEAVGRVVREGASGRTGPGRPAYGVSFEAIPAAQRSEIVRWTRLKGAA